MTLREEVRNNIQRSCSRLSPNIIEGCLRFLDSFPHNKSGLFSAMSELRDYNPKIPPEDIPVITLYYVDYKRKENQHEQICKD